MGTHLGLLGRAGHDQKLCSRVRNLDLSDDGRRIRRHKQSTEVVDDQLVPACTDRLASDSSAPLSRPGGSASPRFASLTIRPKRRPDNLGQLAHRLDVPQHSLLQTRHVLVPGLEQVRAAGFRDFERHGVGCSEVVEGLRKSLRSKESLSVVLVESCRRARRNPGVACLLVSGVTARRLSRFNCVCGDPAWQLGFDSRDTYTSTWPPTRSYSPSFSLPPSCQLLITPTCSLIVSRSLDSARQPLYMGSNPATSTPTPPPTGPTAWDPSLTPAKRPATDNSRESNLYSKSRRLSMSEGQRSTSPHSRPAATSTATREMNDSKDEAEDPQPRLSWKDKGKSKVRPVAELPEEVWKRVFELYYDQCTDGEWPLGFAHLPLSQLGAQCVGSFCRVKRLMIRRSPTYISLSSHLRRLVSTVDPHISIPPPPPTPFLLRSSEDA